MGAPPSHHPINSGEFVLRCPSLTVSTLISFRKHFLIPDHKKLSCCGINWLLIVQYNECCKWVHVSDLGAETTAVGIIHVPKVGGWQLIHIWTRSVVLDELRQLAIDRPQQGLDLFQKVKTPEDQLEMLRRGKDNRWVRTPDFRLIAKACNGTVNPCVKWSLF